MVRSGWCDARRCGQAASNPTFLYYLEFIDLYKLILTINVISIS